MDSYDSRVLQEMMVTLRDIKELMEEVVENLESKQEVQPETFKTVEEAMNSLCESLNKQHNIRLSLRQNPLSHREAIDKLIKHVELNAKVFQREGLTFNDFLVYRPTEQRPYYSWRLF